MTSLRFFIASILVLGAVISAAAASVPSPPADKCFSRTQKCCFKFAQCGFRTTSSIKTVPCPQKQCTKVCEPLCSAASSKRPVEKCVDVKVPIGKPCHGWNKKCTPKFKIEKKCTTTFVVTRTQSCKNVCKTECKTVPGKCRKTEVRTYVRFCARLSCDKATGGMPAPKPVMSKKPSSVKMMPSKKGH